MKSKDNSRPYAFVNAKELQARENPGPSRKTQDASHIRRLIDEKTKSTGSILRTIFQSQERRHTLKTSALLHDAFQRIASPETRVRKVLAANSMGMRTHPTAEDVEAWSSIGSLMKSLSMHYEEGSLKAISLTQKLFFSTGYSLLTEAAQHIGFKTVSDLDELSNEQQFYEMWEAAIATAELCETEDV